MPEDKITTELKAGNSAAKGNNSTDERWETLEKRWRDGILFFIGVAGVLNELFFVSEPRPAALLFLGSLIGVPFVMNADERRRSSSKAIDEDS